MLISFLCHAELLLISGVESYPGPTTQPADPTTKAAAAAADLNKMGEAHQKVLDKLIASALDTDVASTLRLYDVTWSTSRIKSAFNRPSKDILVKTMDYLNGPDQNVFVKKQIADNIVQATDQAKNR